MSNNPDTYRLFVFRVYCHHTMRSLCLFTPVLAMALASCQLLGPNAAQQAEAAYAEQNYVGARDLALAALAADEADAAALEMLVRAQLAMGAGADALAALERLKAADTLPDDAPLLEAEAHLQNGNVALAKPLLQGQNSAESWRLRALAASLVDNDQAAIEAFDRGRKAGGDKARLLAAEATFHLRRDNREAARKAVGRVQTIAPRRVETLLVTAWLAQLEGNAEIAARAFTAILARTPQDRPALLGAIDAMQTLDRDDLADPLITRGRAAYSQDLAFIYFAARSMARRGDWIAARDALQERESELAAHDPAQLLYAEVLLELGQGELARALVTPIHSRRRGDADVAALYTRALEATAG